MCEQNYHNSKVSRTVRPSASVHLGSRQHTTYAVPYIDFSTAYPNERIGYPHSGKGNLLMLDYHVESRTLGQVPDASNYYLTLERKQFWFHTSRE